MRVAVLLAVADATIVRDWLTTVACAQRRVTAHTARPLIVLVVALTLISVLSLTCCTASRWQAAPDHGSSSLVIGDHQGYRIAKCTWYTDEEAVLALWLLGEEPRLSLARCDMRNGRLRQFFDSPFAVDWEDDLLVAPGLFGYQNALNTVTFDRRDLNLTTKATSTPDAIRVYSDDLRWVADIAPDRLTITGGRSPAPVEYQLVVNSTLRWSADGSRAACIGRDRTAVHLLDLESSTYRTTIVGRDIPMPNGFVELMYCWPLPDGQLLLDIAGEEDSPLVLLDIADPAQAYVVPGPGEMTTLATAGSIALYCLRDRSGGVQRLLALDCTTCETSLLFETASEILCASFSPDGTKVLIGLHSGTTGNSLVVCPR